MEKDFDDFRNRILPPQSSTRMRIGSFTVREKNGLTLLKAAIDQYNTSIKLYLNNKNHSLF